MANCSIMYVDCGLEAMKLELRYLQKMLCRLFGTGHEHPSEPLSANSSQQVITIVLLYYVAWPCTVAGLCSSLCMCVCGCHEYHFKRSYQKVNMMLCCWLCSPLTGHRALIHQMSYTTPLCTPDVIIPPLPAHHIHQISYTTPL